MSTKNQPLLIGIDLGTSGVRVLVVGADGHVAGQGSSSLSELTSSNPGAHEQSPAAWWQAVRAALAKALEELDAAGHATDELQGLSVDGTSGTIVPVDRYGREIRPALMYHDTRGREEGDLLSNLADDWCRQRGYRFDSSFGLAKILWLARHEQDAFSSAHRLIHQADYIVGQLAGEPTATDYGNALKTGYDLVERRWPNWLERLPGVLDRLAPVVAPGTHVARVSTAAARETGLPAGLPIIAGTTDGVAAALASGLRTAGDYNTTLGTTLVFKGMSAEYVRDARGLIYSHRLPGGMWLPGAASNVGAAWIGAWFGGRDPAELDRRAAECLPTTIVSYPLVGRGERFPFRVATAEGFLIPPNGDVAERYAAGLTGTALVERLAYAVLDEGAQAAGGAVYSTGGGSRSDLWMQLRANITGRTLHRPRVAESALGSAILAATAVHYESLAEASAAMTGIERTFAPEAHSRGASDALFGAFCEQLAQRGYWPQ